MQDLVSIMENYRRNLKFLPSYVWYKDGEEFARSEGIDDYAMKNMLTKKDINSASFKLIMRRVRKEVSSICREKYR
jgi:hypothetical protein